MRPSGSLRIMRNKIALVCWRLCSAGTRIFGTGARVGSRSVLLVGLLADYAAYSILAAVMMAILVKFAWPKELDHMESNPAKDSRRTRDEVVYRSAAVSAAARRVANLRDWIIRVVLLHFQPLRLGQPRSERGGARRSSPFHVRRWMFDVRCLPASFA